MFGKGYQRRKNQKQSFFYKNLKSRIQNELIHQKVYKK